ncbi:uncharacterized protein LOC121854804 isoform X1 [Homarus americanus]|uniref:Putative Ecdysteroid kinase-containing protein 2 n=1 Tax=Homarus americanus TaxID=6706 RepID=A0A8J5MLB5_HOMAM|nr:uncharacterized protein LOC121854804 isoform X1 [Homarus americanus]KAG7155586.1 putative Ecdysteroid kinase-containing protein 2 [Homarus americanus]
MAGTLLLEPLHSEKQLNKQWLENLLLHKHGSPVTVLSWHCVLPSSREGFLSEIAYVKVIYANQSVKETEKKLVFKFLPQDFESRKFVLKSGIVKREVAFYKLLNSPECGEICQRSGIVLPVPECYFASYAEDCMTIVMQDVSVDHYKTVIVKEGSTIIQTKAAVKAIALVHAFGYVYLKHGSCKKHLDAITETVDVDSLDEDFIPNLQTLASMYEGTPTADTFRALMPLTKALHDYPLRYPLFNTILHGDFWAGQLLFSDDESKAIIIDWQFCNIGNPVCDIMSMFFMSSDIYMVAHHLEEILSDYWYTLTRALEDNKMKVDFTFDHLMANAEELWISGFVNLGCSIHAFLPAGNITEKRLKAAVQFLEDRGVFTKLIQELSCKEG